MSGARARVAGLLAASAILAAALSGCGESSEQKASKAVCSSVSAISSELTKLQSLHVSSQLPEEVRDSVNAISGEINKIKEKAPELEEARRTEIEAANKAFVAELAKAGTAALSSLKGANPQTALEGAATQIKTAASHAASGYKQAFKALSCS